MNQKLRTFQVLKTLKQYTEFEGWWNFRRNSGTKIFDLQMGQTHPSLNFALVTPIGEPNEPYSAQKVSIAARSDDFY